MRAAVHLTLSLVAAIIGLSAAVGVAGSWVAGSIVGLAAALGAGWALQRYPLVTLDEAACSRPLKLLSAVATLGALVQLSRLAVFMIEPSAAAYSFLPQSSWEVRHSCLTAYSVAGQASGEGKDPYNVALYNAPDDTGTGVRRPLKLGPFDVDVYEYPPPFLLLPRAFALVAPTFLQLRPLWYALNLSVVLLAMLVVARSLGPVAGTRALLLSPLVFASLPTLSVLQKGNVQALVVAASMLALALLEKRRFASGGALLAFATLSKLFPGLLGITLIARRQWSAVLWTALAATVLIALTLLDVGWAQFEAFARHLPGLLSGEAFPAFRNPAPMAINSSVPGLVFKLKLFGVPGMGFPAAKWVGWIWTLVAAGAAVALGRRALKEEEKALGWLALLILATLRSPFLPQAYAAFPPLWLLTVLAATFAPTLKTLAWVVCTWLALNIYIPLDVGLEPRVRALINGVPQAVTLALAVWVLIRRAPAVEGSRAR
jgi:alpha-1,2-mannosyltransferase